jgi:L,D-peptidoglycan transpeptidase YkuD (ErfK/YbiS/YcfS/YnhG family)
MGGWQTGRMYRAALAMLSSALLAGCSDAGGGADEPATSTASVPATSTPASVVTASVVMGGMSAITLPPSPTSTTAIAPATSTTLPPADDCARVAARAEVSHPGATQVVVVRTVAATDTTAALQVAERTAAGWVCGPSLAAMVGRAGVRPLVERRSGDGTTPAGVFALGTMTAWDGQVFSFFGNKPDPGVSAGSYRAVREGDCFGATPNHPDYGHLVQRSRAQCPGPDDEYLPSFPTAYEHAALIGANMEPNVSGDAPGEPPYAAAIFLHRFSYDAAGRPKPTAGCVSLAHDDLVAVLTALRADVLFAIGDNNWLLANA